MSTGQDPTVQEAVRKWVEVFGMPTSPDDYNPTPEQKISTTLARFRNPTEEPAKNTQEIIPPHELPDWNPYTFARVPSQEEIDAGSHTNHPKLTTPPVVPKAEVQVGADGIPIIPSLPYIPDTSNTISIPTNTTAAQYTQPKPTVSPENLGKTMMDMATIKGLLGDGGNLSRLAPLDPIARTQFAPMLIELKKLYSEADNPIFQNAMGMSAEEIKERIHRSAESFRSLGKAMGLDLSGYTGDTTLADAYHNLATEKARALFDLRNGQYKLRSDEFLQKRYAELVGQGLDIDKAARVAELEARKYSGERARYLSDQLYAYGFDENNVMTREGENFAAQLAGEDPISAELYLKTNPTENNAYEQASAIAQAMLNNDAASDRLTQQILGNFDLATLNARNSLNLADFNAQNAFKLAERENENANNRWYLQETQKRKWAPQDQKALYQAKFDILKSIHGEEKAKAILEAEAGIRTGNVSGKSPYEQFKVVAESWDLVTKSLMKQKENILSRYSEGKLPQSVKNQIADIDERINMAEDSVYDMAVALNLTKGVTDSTELPRYTGAYDDDVQTVRAMLAYNRQDAAGRRKRVTEEDEFNAVKAWVHATNKNVSDKEIKRLVYGANGKNYEEEERKDEANKARKLFYGGMAVPGTGFLRYDPTQGRLTP